MNETTAPDEAGWGNTPLDNLPAVLTLARHLADQREHVELQGVVLHRSPDLTLAATAALAAAVALIGQIYPLLGVIVLLLVLLSALTDLAGGQGWVRRLLVIKDIGHTILLWRGDRLPPPREPPFYRKRPPTPAEQPLLARPTLLVCIPTDAPPRPGLDLFRASLLIAGLVGVVLSALGLILSAWISLNVTVWGALLLLFLAALSAGRHLLHAPPAPSPAIAASLPWIAASRAAPPRNLTLAFAFLEGIHPHGHADTLEILLRNYALLLPPAHTRVLLLSPGSGPLTGQGREGPLRRPADDLLLRLAPARHDGLGSSAAMRALRLGWRAATLQGDLSDTGALMSLLQRLDDAAAQEW